MLAYECPCPHEAGKTLHLLDRKGMVYYLKNKSPFSRLATGTLVSNA